MVSVSEFLYWKIRLRLLRLNLGLLEDYVYRLRYLTKKEHFLISSISRQIFSYCLRVIGMSQRNYRAEQTLQRCNSDVRSYIKSLRDSLQKLYQYMPAIDELFRQKPRDRIMGVIRCKEKNICVYYLMTSLHLVSKISNNYQRSSS